MVFRGQRADRGYHDFAVLERGRQGKGRVSRVWEVIAAPEDYSEFVGRLFRLTDLKFGEWPPGFVFRNTHTGQIWRFPHE